MQVGDSYCQICRLDPFKYVCPRCNVPYCSVNCYKAVSHSLCSEAFYKECVQEYIHSQEVKPESRGKMLEILQRVEENDACGGYVSDSDSDDCDSITERLDGINLDDANSVWVKLTDEEKKEFINFVKDGDVTHVIPVWEPWWNIVYPKPKVRFIDEVDQDCPEYIGNIPINSKNIPPFSKILKSKPSELIFFNLANVLGAYSFIARYFNGEQITMAEEASMILLTISKNLFENDNFTSIENALDSVMQEVLTCEFIHPSENLRNTLQEDVSNILKGPNDENFNVYILAALSDLYNLLLHKNKANKSPKGAFTQIFQDSTGHTKRYCKKDLFKCAQKIKYFQSWCIEFYKKNIYF